MATGIKPWVEQAWRKYTAQVPGPLAIENMTTNKLEGFALDLEDVKRIAAWDIVQLCNESSAIISKRDAIADIINLDDISKRLKSLDYENATFHLLVAAAKYKIDRKCAKVVWAARLKEATTFVVGLQAFRKAEEPDPNKAPYKDKTDQLEGFVMTTLKADINTFAKDPPNILGAGGEERPEWLPRSLGTHFSGLAFDPAGVNLKRHISVPF